MQATFNPYTGRITPVDVRLDKMSAFGSGMYFRDAKGLSSHPAILPFQKQGGRYLRIQDSFLVQYEYLVTPEQGARFLEITKDPNEIHARHSVTPGALTAAKVFVPIEVLVPSLRIRSVRAKFRAPAFYNSRTLCSMHWRYTGERDVRLHVTTYQNGAPVATVIASAEIDTDFAPPAIKERKVNREEFEKVSEFFQALGVDPEAYFDKEGLPDYTYPFAYLAALPSAEIVRQMEGQGGMINVLSLELGDQPKMPMTGKTGPEVKLSGGRLRRAFKRILTDIIDGIVTYYRGSAVVNPTADFL